MAVVPFSACEAVKTVAALDSRILRPGTFVESLGYGRAVLGMGFMDITHPDDHGISRAVHRWLLDGHSRLIVTKRYIAKGGRVVSATMRIELVHDRRGRPRYLRAWPEDSGADWGAASATPPIRRYADVRVVREGFVAESISDDPATGRSSARRVGRLILPPELL